MNAPPNKTGSGETVVAIVVAAGRGERMRADGNGPKQYRMLGGKSVIQHSLAAFLDHPQVTMVQPVIHADDKAIYAEHAPAHGKLLPPVTGGKTRQQSVLAGLEAALPNDPDKVLIHDAARPFVDADTIDRLIAVAESGRGALPAHRVADTLKRADAEGTVTQTVDRDGLWAAQTPQAFVFSDILPAHRAAIDGSHTDDASIAEAAGIKVALVESPASNFKLTGPEDMMLAEAILARHATEFRTGHGYDVHRLAEGGHMLLCGVRIEDGLSLIGHSDADVGLHALTDALLATVAAGDIGDHFPPSDPKWKGASSDQFLSHAVGIVRASGGTILHLDCTIVCERPKIGPHRDAMRARIAEIAEIDVARVSVKATTNETVGFIGRGEGIAALATASVRLDGARA